MNPPVSPFPQTSTHDVDALFTKSRSFCALPWRQMYASIDGIFARCCVDQTQHTGAFDKPAGSAMHLNPGTLGCLKTSPYAKDNPDKVTTLAAAFNAPEMRATRAAMLSGQRVAACRECYEQERSVGASMRLSLNEIFRLNGDWPSLFARTDAAGHLDAQPILLDLRLGNHCNLTCEMCSYPVSSAWLKFTSLGHKTAIIDPYRHDEEFWSDVRANAPFLSRVTLAGGEPFIQAGHYHLLKLLIEAGEAHHIEMVYTSNLTVLPRRAFDLWPKFKGVEVGASCDGFGEVYESIRRGAKWESFAANVLDIRKRATTKITVTIQRENVLTLAPLWEWAHEHSLPVEMTNLLTWPEPMNAKLQGKVALEQGRQGYLQLASSYRERHNEALARSIESLCAALAELCKSPTTPP